MVATAILLSTAGDGTAVASPSLQTSVRADGRPSRANDGGSPETLRVGDDDAVAQKSGKLTGDLALLSRAAQQGGPDAAIATARSRDLATRNDRVQIVVEGSDDERSATRGAIQNAGGNVEGEYGNLVQASVPIAVLDELSNDPSVRYVRRPLHGFPDAIASEGVAASGAGTWQAGGRTGAGAKIAVIDFGFTNYQARQASGDLPGNLITKDQCGGNLNAAGGEHGVAVAEIVYEMAPGAQLYLICVDTDVDLGLAKDYAKANGINVIVHSASWFNTSRGDGSGTTPSPDATVADARNNGILWVNSAGNRGQQHWSGTFSDTDGNGLHNFNPPGEPADNGNTVFLSTNQQICVFLRWDAWPTTNIDYDLRITTSQGGTLVAQSATLQSGFQPPTESVCYTNKTGTSQTFAISIKKTNAPTSPRLDLFVAPGPDLEWQTADGSVTEPGSSPNAMAVGAVCWQNNRLEEYSGRGPTIDGRTKPDIAGQSVVSSATFGPWISCPANAIGTGNTSFNGTSAAAPHVGGAAALVKGANPSFTPAQIQSFLEGRAVDLGTAGKDNSFGAGVLALGALTDPGPSPNPAPGAQVSVSATDATVAEPISGTTTVSVPVSLSAPSAQAVTVQYATANGVGTGGAAGSTSCGPGVDYQVASGSLTFNPSETTKTVPITICSGAISPPSETFTLSLSTPTGGATLGTHPTATVTISAANVPPCQTTLSAAVPAGSTTLPVVSQRGCNVGDHIAINPGTSTEEREIVIGFGSILIDQPTKYAHQAGEPIRRLAITDDLWRPISSPEDDTDKPRKETDEERQQRHRTNASNRDDEHTEGNVLAVTCDADPPTITIANRDGDVDIHLQGDAAQACRSARVGDYLEADGEKQNEQLYDASDVTLHRDGERVR
jgi:hypothetical protein